LSSESGSSSGRLGTPEFRTSKPRRGAPHQIENDSEEDDFEEDYEEEEEDTEEDFSEDVSVLQKGGGGKRHNPHDRMQKQQQKGRSPKLGIRNLEEILAEAKKTPAPVVPKAVEKPSPPTPAAAGPHKATQAPAPNTVAPAAGNAKQKQPFSWLASRTISEDKHAKVSKGFNFSLGQSIVIKQYTLYDVPPEMRQERYDLIERIEGEVKRAANQLPKHDHIIHYIDSSFSDNSLYIFTEFLAGGSLEAVIKEANRLEESVIKRYTKQVLQAISLLHSKGFSNLNVKVSNMLLDNQGNIKLCDYVATQELSDLITNVFRTNMDYFLLQDERTKEAQHRKMDIQSLGWAIIEMATGSKDQRTLPESFSKEARGFVEFCIKGFVCAAYLSFYHHMRILTSELIF
jgi:serine/threonine protein kinase